MLYYIFKLLQESGFPGARLFGYTSFRALTAIVLALLISTIFGEYLYVSSKKDRFPRPCATLTKTT